MKAPVVSRGNLLARWSRSEARAYVCMLGLAIASGALLGLAVVVVLAALVRR